MPAIAYADPDTGRITYTPRKRADLIALAPAMAGSPHYWECVSVWAVHASDGGLYVPGMGDARPWASHRALTRWEQHVTACIREEDDVDIDNRLLTNGKQGAAQPRGTSQIVLRTS